MSKPLNKVGRIATASVLSVGALGAITPANAVPVQNLLGAIETPNKVGDIAQIGELIPAGFIPPAPVAIPALPVAKPAPAPAPESPSLSELVAPVAQQERQASLGQAIVNAARSRTGSPYVWGAAGPSSFDCSGLVMWAHQQVGLSIPRTSQAQISAGTPVSLDNLQPGDVIGYYGGNSHVGIYVGNGMIIDALNSGVPVQERSLHYMPINSAVRFH